MSDDNRFSQNWEMPNNATYADWMGTAALAARLGADLLEEARKSPVAPSVDVLRAAEVWFKQAHDEARALLADATAGDS